MSKEQEVLEARETNEVADNSRRKVVKTLVGGATALAAFNLLPARWDKPLVESIFLPAHAETSGEVSKENPFIGTWVEDEDPTITTIFRSDMSWSSGWPGGSIEGKYSVSGKRADVVEEDDPLLEKDYYILLDNGKLEEHRTNSDGGGGVWLLHKK